MCKSLTNYFPRNNDFLVTYFGKTQICLIINHIEFIIFYAIMKCPSRIIVPINIYIVAINFKLAPFCTGFIWIRTYICCNSIGCKCH